MKKKGKEKGFAFVFFFNKKEMKKKIKKENKKIEIKWKRKKIKKEWKMKKKNEKALHLYFFIFVEVLQ